MDAKGASMLVFSAAGTLALGLTLSQRSAQGGAVTTPQTTRHQLDQVVLTLPGLAVQPTDCAALFTAGDVSDHALCYATHLSAAQVAPMLLRALGDLAVTPRWSEDYGVPGALYALKANHDQTFSVSVRTVSASAQLRSVPTLRGYGSFVTVSVNPHPGQR